MNILANTRVLSHPTTGVERYLIELLARMGPDIAQCAPQSPLGGIKGHAWEQLVLPAKLRGRLLFSPCNTGPLAVKNQVVTIHDVAALDHPEWLNAKFALWYRWLTPRLARRCRHIIAVSEFTRGRIIAHTGIPPEKITVIPNGVDARFKPMAPEAILAALAPLALPSRRYILSLGSIEPRKNLPRLLQAWAKILPTLPPDIWLVVAGGSNARIFAAANAMGDKETGREKPRAAANPQASPAGQNGNSAPLRVHYAGRVADDLLPALYAGAMAFAYMSVYEGFGLPPLEAMAAGVPVLTGNLTSLPEVVGDAGIMVNPLDTDAVAGGLLQLIENAELRARLGSAGMQRSRQFTWDKSAEKTMAVLREMNIRHAAS